MYRGDEQVKHFGTNTTYGQSIISSKFGWIKLCWHKRAERCYIASVSNCVLYKHKTIASNGLNHLADYNRCLQFFALNNLLFLVYFFNVRQNDDML